MHQIKAHKRRIDQRENIKGGIPKNLEKNPFAFIIIIRYRYRLLDID
jgi:hypothetical protein